MSKLLRARWRAVLSGALGLGLVVAIAPAAGAHGGGGGHRAPIVPIHGSYAGRSYGQWSAAWWQWAFSIPVSTSPLFDDTGANCGVAQQGPVWFLAGSFSATPLPNGGFEAIAHRTCEVPASKAIFFPILNAEADNACGDGTPAELKQTVEDLLNVETSVSATIDGRAIADASDLRAASPFFRIKLPADNLNGCPAGSRGTAFSDGYYVLAKPLGRGHHTVNFQGEVPGFRLDITYDLVVR